MDLSDLVETISIIGIDASNSEVVFVDKYGCQVTKEFKVMTTSNQFMGVMRIDFENGVYRVQQDTEE